MNAIPSRWTLPTIFLLMALVPQPSLADEPPGIVESGFIFGDDPPTPSCHASTIVEARRGILAAWFGGTDEGEPDVAIYLARLDGGKWSKPAKVFDGVQDDARRFPCWNPVLFRPKNGPILLFAKVGPSPSKWWGVLSTSDDDGLTWSKPRRLPEGILGPIKNKPISMADGAPHLLCRIEPRAREAGLARLPRADRRPRLLLVQGRPAQRRPVHRRDTTEHPDPPGRQAPDSLPLPTEENRRGLVRRRPLASPGRR